MFSTVRRSLKWTNCLFIPLGGGRAGSLHSDIFSPTFDHFQSKSPSDLSMANIARFATCSDLCPSIACFKRRELAVFFHAFWISDRDRLNGRTGSFTAPSWLSGGGGPSLGSSLWPTILYPASLIAPSGEIRWRHAKIVTGHLGSLCLTSLGSHVALFTGIFTSPRLAGQWRRPGALL